jgi:predicted nuclease of predicted toxin-antitoxin system
MRFHLDESVDHAIARGLSLRGVDVTTSTNAHLIGATDEEQLSFALQESRVLFTQDDDFLKLHADGVEHVGIAYCAPESCSIGHVVRRLCLMHDCMSEQEMTGRVEFL